MVAGILGLFVLVDRIDALIELLSVPGSPAAVVRDRMDRGSAETSAGHVVTSLGDDHTGTRPQPRRTPASEEATGARSEHPPQDPDLPPARPVEDQTPDTSSDNNEEGEDPVICPSRPGKGSRMSDNGRELASRPRIPAQSGAEEPDVPDRRPAYQAGPSAHTAPARSAPRQHRIKKGETLWRIATQYYGDGEMYRIILEANPDLDPKKLHVGARIRVPRDPSATQLARARQE
jgi:LysM repeat protein